jgi:anti-sigma factor RsiW
MTERDCWELAMQVVELIDGTLPAQDVRVVEEHLSRCESCSERVTRLRQVDALIRGAATPLPSNEEWSGLIARATRPVLIHWPRVAAAAVIAIALPLSLRLYSRPSDVPSEDDVITPALDTDL